MKAYSLNRINELKYEEVDYPEVGPGWAVVKVKASGICSSDIDRVFIKGTYHFPTIPGHEISGIVDKVFDLENSELIGKRVGVFPLIPCKKCVQCAKGNYELCDNYDYIGSRRDGGFAEYVAVPVWNLIELPHTVSFKEAAMMEPLAVALHAIKMADIKKGEKVAIIGTGMIAFAASQWAKKLGASSVNIFGRTEQKRELAESIPGINYFVDNDATEFDVVLEAVGSNSAINKAINLTKVSGKLILMGNPSEAVTLEQNTYWRILRKQIRIIGTWNSSYEHGKKCDWTDVRDALIKHEITAMSLISHVFPKERLEEGLKMMLIHKEPFCKVMICWDDEVLNNE